MDFLYYQRKLFMMGMLLLVIIGANVGFAAVSGKNLMSMLLGKNSLVAYGICVAAGIAAIGIGMYRDSYLPFLGPTVMPCSLLKEQIPEGADTEVRVMVGPGAKVLFWASEPSNNDLSELKNWREAYLGFKNAGVAIAGEDGYATLKVRRPQAYTVPMKGALEKHVHYRVCGDGGMIGRVETVHLNNKEMFIGDSEEMFVGDVKEMFVGDGKEMFVGDGEEMFVGDGKEMFVGDGEEMFVGDGEEIEKFTNFQEEHESVSENTEGRYVKPAAAMTEINIVSESTLRGSLMPDDGAFVEAPQPAGAPLDAAFGGM